MISDGKQYLTAVKDIDFMILESIMAPRINNPTLIITPDYFSGK
jgi:hypothetical protein